jgi:hypothetical protein
VLLNLASQLTIEDATGRFRTVPSQSHFLTDEESLIWIVLADLKRLLIGF